MNLAYYLCVRSYKLRIHSLILCLIFLVLIFPGWSWRSPFVSLDLSFLTCKMRRLDCKIPHIFKILKFNDSTMLDMLFKSISVLLKTCVNWGMLITFLSLSFFYLKAAKALHIFRIGAEYEWTSNSEAASSFTINSNYWLIIIYYF